MAIYKPTPTAAEVEGEMPCHMVRKTEYHGISRVPKETIKSTEYTSGEWAAVLQNEEKPILGPMGDVTQADKLAAQLASLEWTDTEENTLETYKAVKKKGDRLERLLTFTMICCADRQGAARTEALAEWRREQYEGAADRLEAAGANIGGRYGRMLATTVQRLRDAAEAVEVRDPGTIDDHFDPYQ